MTETGPQPQHKELSPASRNRLYLALGALLIVAANLRWGVGVLAWLAPLPLMRFLRLAPGWRPRMALAVALPVAWTLAVVKIITAPLPFAAAPGFGVPVGLFFVAAYLAWDALRRRADDWRAALSFPALMVGVEWLQARSTPLGSWGAVAYTQLDDLPLLQMASLFGLAGVGWIVYGVAAALDRGFAAPPAERRRWFAGVALAVLAAHAFGFARLTGEARHGRMVNAAAVGTDASFGRAPLPSAADIQRVENALFDRTQRAAAAGASLVVWTEAATLVYPERQRELLSRAAAAARVLNIELVAAYVVPVSQAPLLYENKYVWLRPDGETDQVYLKHEPVPGEPAIRGTDPPRVVNTAFGRASGAICYDYDFPYLAARHARLAVDVIALPSSDWLGIDPIHTQMASLRAIEGGFSILRSTRMGLSAGIDPYGRLRGWLSSHESDERVLVVTLPAESVPTLYARIGDTLVYLGLAYAVWVSVALWRARPRPVSEPAKSPTASRIG